MALPTSNLQFPQDPYLRGNNEDELVLFFSLAPASILQAAGSHATAADNQAARIGLQPTEQHHHKATTDLEITYMMGP